MATIDSLDIQIAASTEQANKAIRHLTRNLGALSTALKIDTSGLEKIGKSLNLSRISKSVKSANTEMQKISKSAAEAAKEFQNKFKDISVEVDFSKPEAEMQKFQRQAQAAQNALSRIMKSSSADKQIGSIERYSISLAQATNAVKLLENHLAEMQSIHSQVDLRFHGMEEAEKSLEDYENELSNLRTDIKTIEEEFEGIENIPKGFLDTPIENLEGNLTSLKNAYPQATATIVSFEDELERLKAISASLTREPVRPIINTDGMRAKIDEAAKELNEFKIKLGQIEVPPIQEENLNKLQASLSKTEIKLETLRVKLENGMTMGDIAVDVNDRGFVKLQKEIAYTKKYAEALRAKISQVKTANNQASQSTENLGKSMSRLRNNAGALSKSMSGVGRNVKSFTRQLLSAAGVIGGFSAAVKGIKESIQGFSEYAESYNYFNVAFGKIASEWDEDFEKYGYDNAESYAESFTKRMGATLGKLSGVQVNLDTGLLEETGLKNLGLNIQEVTQYASQLASVTNSIGQVGEVSLATAKSMTMLAGDVSSLFNVDYGTVAKDIQSVLMGQSRAGYKYGWDTTVAQLQSVADRLNLSKPVSEMTLVEKQQLRILAILDQSQVAWGDLANTISSPSNMMRQFSTNVKEAGLILGQLFIPVLQKVMPIANGAAIAFKRLFTSIAGLLDVEIDFGDFKQNTGDLEGDLEGITDGFNEAAAAAKEWKNQLLSFDEANVLSDASDAAADQTVGFPSIDLSGDILDAVSNYEKVWNKAFAGMENAAKKWADQFEKYLEPVKDIFEDIQLGDFFKLGEDVGGMAMNIYNWLTSAIEDVNWTEVGKNIAGFMNGALKKINGNDIAKGINAFRKMFFKTLISFVKDFDFAEFGKTIGELISGIEWGQVAWDFLTLVDSLIKGISSAIVSFFKAAPIEAALITSFAVLKISGAGEKLWNSVKGGFENSMKSMGGFSGLLTTDLNTIMGAGTVTEKATAIGTGIASAIGAAIAGWNIGQSIFESLNPDDDWITDMGFAGQIEYLFGELIGADTNFKDDFNYVAKVYEDFADRVSKANEKITNPLKTIESSEQQIQPLIDKFLELYGKEKLTNDELKEMQGLKETLKGFIPELIPVLDDETQSYEDMKTAIQGVIDKTFEKAKIEAAKETLVEYYKNYPELMAEYEQKLKDVEEKEKALQDLRKEANKLGNKIFAPTKAYYDSQIIAAERALQTSRNALSTTENNLKQIEESYKNAEEVIFESSAKAAGEAELAAYRQGKAAAYNRANYESTAQVAQASSQKASNANGGISGSFINAKQVIATETPIIQRLFGNLGTSSQNTENTIKTSNTGVANSFGSLKDRLSTTFGNITSLFSTKLNKPVADSKGNVSSGTSSMKTDFDSLLTKTRNTIPNISSVFGNVFKKSNYVEYGKNVLEGTKEGLSDTSLWDKVSSTVSNFAGGISKTFKSILGIHSPSKVFEQFGMFTIEGFNLGLLENMKTTESYMGDWADKLAGYTFNPIAPPEFSYEPQAVNISDLTSDITTDIAFDISAQVRQAAYEGMKTALQEHGGIDVNLEFEPNEVGIFKVTQKGARNYTAQTGLSPFPV